MHQINTRYMSQESYKNELLANSVHLKSSSILLQLFTSNVDQTKVQTVLDEILEITPNAVVIGASTFGEIVDGKMCENELVLAISLFESSHITATYAVDDDSEKLGEKIATKLLTRDTKVIISFVDGLVHNGQFYLHGINRFNSNKVPIAGGMAADLKYEKTFTIFQNKIFSSGAVAVALSGDDLEVHQDYNLGWRTIGPKFTITKSEGNRVYEIDNRPIKEVYEDVLGEAVVDAMPASTAEFPLIKESKSGLIARTMIAVNEDGSIIFAGNLSEGKQVQFGIGSSGLVNEYTPSKEIMDSEIQAIFTYSCAARKQFLGDSLEKVFHSLNTFAPTAGFFTFGEFYSKDADDNFLNITSTFLYLNEKRSLHHARIKSLVNVGIKNLKDDATLHIIDYITQKLQEFEVALHHKDLFLEDYLYKIDSVLIISKTDPNGYITYANKKFVEISGYSKEELLGQPHNIVRHPENSKELFEDLWKTIKSKKVWNGSFANLAKDGSTYYVKTSILPILEDGEIKEYLAIREDITELVETTKRLKEQEEYAKMLFDTEDSIVAVLKNDQLIALNDKFFDEYSYKNFEEFRKVHRCICELFVEAEGYLHATKEYIWYRDIFEFPNVTHKAMMVNKKGKTIIYSVTANQRELNNESYIVAKFYDITELEEAKIAALSALETKSTFLANMSHEIRTPMNGILGFVDLLQNTELNTIQTKYLDTIQSSTKTLLTIINDILDFSKIDSNSLELEYIPVNVIKLVNNIYLLLKPLAEKKNIEYNLHVRGVLSECLLIDPTRLSQILTNLTSNAIKFTNDNGVVNINIEVVETSAGDQTIYFELEDNGIGIAKENQQKIFDAFSQANSSTTREFGGTGLGLSISAQLVSSMGSKLNVLSDEGLGSKFFFTLKLDRCSHSETKILEHEEHDTLLSKEGNYEILIAEDYEINRMLIENLLDKDHLHLTFVYNGLEAVELVKQKQFDLILMDINMPIMNGVQATKVIREELKMDIPIIALTANAIEGDRERFMQEGMSDYLSKPIILTELNRVLLKYLDDKKDAVSNEEFVLDDVLQAMEKNLSIPNSITMKMLKSVAKNIDTTLLALKEAIDSGDSEQMIAVTHKLKGSSGSLQLLPVYKIVTQMEKDALANKRVDFISRYDKIHRYYDTLKEVMRQESK